MSDRMIRIGPGFNLQETVFKLSQMYQASGFSVSVIPMGNGVVIDFKKDDEGVKKYIGLALGIKANIMVSNDILTINFTDAEWTGKIIGFAIGWITCFFPIVTALIGSVKQSDLPKKIGDDIQMIVMGNNPGQQYNPSQPIYQNEPVQTSEDSQPDKTLCSQCGALLDADTVFCAKCGTKK